MSGRRDESLLLEDIVDAAERLIELGGRAQLGNLGSDRDIDEMVMLNLVVLGEAAKRLRPATRDRFGDVPWSGMIATRDRVVHHYEGMEWDKVEEIIAEDLQPLLPRLREIRDLLRVEFDAAP